MKKKNNTSIHLEVRKKVLERDNFTCQKCGFQDKTIQNIEIHHIKPKIFGSDDNLDNLITLCSICHHYAPDSESAFQTYISEKIDGNILNTFRKAVYSISQKTRLGMDRKAREGGIVTRAPLGYKIVNKKLEIDTEKVKEVKEIYEEFLSYNISLNKLAKKHGLTVNGLKKVLKNRTYLGEIKFAGQTSKGIHKPMIEKELFDKVQEKLSRLR